MLTFLVGWSCVCMWFVRGDNFPSLLTTNATLGEKFLWSFGMVLDKGPFIKIKTCNVLFLYLFSAVVIDREFVSEEYDSIKESVENYLVYAKREILKHGGVNVQYYSWTTINVKRGKDV